MKPGKSERENIENPNTTTHTRNWIYSLIIKIPVLGDILRIANAYVYDGDLASDIQLAPLRFWIRKHYKNFIIVVGLTIISTPNIWFCESMLQHLAINTKEPVLPGGLIITIFPSVLGFGIGVYALIFGLSDFLVKKLQGYLDAEKESGKSESGSILMLNVDMAYPLLIITLSLGIGVLQQIFVYSIFLQLVAWFALWYSILMIIEILTVLFGLGEHELLNKLKK